MNPLHDLSAIDVVQWRELHRRALAAGGGWTVPPELERLAATDELVALAVPEPVFLAVLAVCTEGPREPSPECASALSGTAAGVVRLLDRALAADGRDTGYPVEARRERVFHGAQVRALAVSRLPLERLPLGTLVEASAEAAADVVMALHRDRLGVPEGLADALASLLVLYAAGVAIGG
jgi:hypothetical protein